MDLLDDTATRPLTLVSAPAGYGKTIAVRQFLAATEHPAVWMTPGRADGPTQVWRELLRVLRTTALAGSPGPAPHEADDLTASVTDDVLLDMLLTLVNGVDASHHVQPLIVVLDGLDAAGWDADSLEAFWGQLTYFVDSLGSHPLHIVALTRQSLPLPLGRWRTQGRVAEIGHEDLRFQADETEVLLERMGHRNLDGHHVLALTDRAEGWPVGLQLLARSLGDRVADNPARAAEPVDPGKGQALLRRLLSGHPPEVEDFLVTTSVLDRFTADVCRAVTGSSDAGRLLRTVEDANLFVVPLDEERQWFRYQRLFAELLRGKLTGWPPDAVEGLHQRAAAWFREHRDVRQALGHLTGAGRIGQALSLANEDAYRSWWESSFLGTDWSELFPNDWVEGDPERMIDFAMLLGRSGHLEQTKEWLDRAEKDLEDIPADHPGHLSLLAAKALWHAVYLHAGRSIELSQQVLKMLDDQEEHAGTRLLRDRLLVAILNSYWLLDDLDGAEEVCDMLDAGVHGSGVMRDIIVPATRARLALRRGHLHEAYDVGQFVLRTTDMMGLPRHPARRDAELAVGGVAAEWGDLELAEKLISTTIHERDKVGWVAIGAVSRIELARARVLCQGPTAGLAVVDEARAVVHGHPVGPELIGMLDAFEAGLRIDMGDIPAADRLLDPLPAGQHRTLLQLRLAIARGQPEHAADLLRQVSPANTRQQVVTNLLAARVADALGQSDRPDADVWQDSRDRHLRNAIALGTQEGFRRTFAVEAPELARLTDRFDAGPLSSSGGRGDDPVTDREMSVLRYLPSRLTNREIANELEVSGNTLKTHLRSLYRKLGVRSRSDAVIEARRAGLL